MRVRHSVIGIALLCALLVGAYTTTAAMGAPGRAFTCAPGGTEFSDAHCLTAGTGFGHVSIANGTNTQVTGTNSKTASGTTASTPFKLKGKIAGVATEIQCIEHEEVTILINSPTFVTFSTTTTLRSCSVTLPAGRECVVTGGKITSNELMASTEGLTNSNEVKTEPSSGTELFGVPISGCKNNSPPSATYPVDGSFISTASGATLSTTHAGITTQGTLTFGGNPAGTEGAVTLSMKEGNPIVLT
jgi:hypothetical protein